MVWFLGFTIIGEGSTLKSRLDASYTRLGDIASIFVGLQTSSDKIYVLAEVEGSTDNKVSVQDSHGNHWMLERDYLKPFLYHSTVSTFEPPQAGHWLIFPYEIVDGRVTLVPARTLQEKSPETWKYLKQNESALRKRESGKADTAEWYGYIYRKNLTLFEDPKLIVQVISLHARYAYDDQSLYFTGGGNGPYYGIRWRTNYGQHSIYYLQALLNSSLLDYYLKQVSSPFRGGYWSYGKRFIEQLPIRLINFSNPVDVSFHDRLVALVKQILGLNVRINTDNNPQLVLMLRRQFSALLQQSNMLIYELYGSTEDEIQIIEKQD